MGYIGRWAEKMTPIFKADWDSVHEVACEIVNARARSDDVVSDSRKCALMHLLDDLEKKYGRCSRLTATRADYAEEEAERTALYEEALQQAQAEGDTENEALIVESIAEMKNET